MTLPWSPPLTLPYTHGRVCIYAGNGALQGLQLQAEAPADLDLPVTVSAGLVGSLSAVGVGASLARALSRLGGCHATGVPSSEHCKGTAAAALMDGWMVTGLCTDLYRTT